MKGNQHPVCSSENQICPIIYGVSAIARKWHLPVLCILEQMGTQRYGQLKRLLPNITDMMLTQTLKDLGQRGLVERVQYNEIPPRVEYSLTQEGSNLSPALKKMAAFGTGQIERSGEGTACTNCLDLSQEKESIYDIMQNEPDDWNQKHLEAYEALCSDPQYEGLSPVEKIKRFVRNAMLVLTHDDQEYTRLTYLLLMDENIPILVGDDRQYYIILRRLVEDAKESGCFSGELSVDELMDRISVFQTGMIVKWRLNREEMSILEKNERMLDWFFARLQEPG